MVARDARLTLHAVCGKWVLTLLTQLDDGLRRWRE